MGDQGNRGAAIDRLLRRALEAGAGAQPGVCPGPDVVAAYLEGELSGHEREEFERHAGSCERCLATLAAVAEIAPLPVTGEAPERARSWWRGAWPWLAPLTAAATAAVVYVAVRPVPLPGPASTAPVVTDRLAEAGDPAAGGRRPADIGQKPKQPMELEPQAPATFGHTTETGQAQGQSARSEVPGAQESGAAERMQAQDARPTERLARRREEDKGPGAPGAPAGAAASAPAAAIGGPLAAGRIQEASKVAAPPAEAQVAEFAPAPAPVPAAPPPTAAAPSPAKRADAAEAQSPALPAGPQARVEQAQAARAEASNEARAGAASARDVAQPASQPQWRVGRNGRIDRSDDGGRSWLAQVSGVSIDLFAVDAVTSTTAWVVGARGVVLVTSDGRGWQRVSPPADVDLVAVDAGDASRAVVTARDGRRFATTDGGRTWARH